MGREGRERWQEQGRGDVARHRETEMESEKRNIEKETRARDETDG